MMRIDDTKTHFSAPPLILGLSGLALGMVLTGVAAKLLKNNRIWWAAPPTGAAGYGIGHLAARRFVARNPGTRGQNSREQSGLEDKDSSAVKKRQEIEEQPTKHTQELEAERAVLEAKFERRRAKRKRELEAMRAEYQSKQEAMQAGYQQKPEELLAHSSEPTASPSSSDSPREDEEISENLLRQAEDHPDDLLKLYKELKDRLAPEQLMIDAGQGEYEKVRSTLESQHLDPSAEEGGSSALHQAILHGDHKMVELLLPYCKDVNRVCGRRNAIQQAIWHSDAKMCQLLLKNGAILGDADRSSGSSYLHKAVCVGDASKLEAIVGCFENIDVEDAEGRTAAQVAARSGKVEQLEILLAHGAKLGKAGFNEEEWAELTPEVQNQLSPSEAGSDQPDIQDRDDPSSQSAEAIEDQLVNDVSETNYDRVRSVLESQNIDPSAETDNSSALLQAVCNHDHKMVELLLPHCLDVNRVCSGGRNAIRQAIWESDSEMCRLLLNGGALLDDADRHASMPYLHVAVRMSDSKTLDTIIDCFENIDIVDAAQQTPARIAAQGGKVEHLKILFAHGAKLGKADFDEEEWAELTPEIQNQLSPSEAGSDQPDIQDQDDSSSQPAETIEHQLFTDADQGDHERVRLLLESQDLDPSAEIDGSSALHQAIRCNDHQMVELLLPYCKDVNRKCGGRNAIQQAIWHADAKMCQLLLDNGSTLSDANDTEAAPCLHVTVHMGDLEKLKVIINYFKNIDVKDKRGRTAARVAARCVEVGHLQLLLDHGAKLGKKDFTEGQWAKLAPVVQTKLLRDEEVKREAADLPQPPDRSPPSRVEEASEQRRKRQLEQMQKLKTNLSAFRTKFKRQLSERKLKKKTDGQ